MWYICLLYVDTKRGVASAAPKILTHMRCAILLSDSPDG